MDLRPLQVRAPATCAGVCTCRLIPEVQLSRSPGCMQAPSWQPGVLQSGLLTCNTSEALRKG